MPQGACRGYGTIRPATPTDCRYAESIHRICHRPAAAARASETHFSGLGPPWRSHPCIEGYPQCHRVRAVGMERSDRQHQPIADTQSRFTVYVTRPAAAARASETHFSGLGPPWRSHPCIEGYPQCHRVRAVGMERSDRQHQPIDYTHVNMLGHKEERVSERRLISVETHRKADRKTRPYGHTAGKISV